MMTATVAAERRTPVILLAEDNMDHAFLTREALRDAGVQADMHHVTDGVEAMKFLRGQAPYEGAPRPDLVLLDIHMPRMDGYEVMQQLGADPALKSLPVVVLTTSADALDVERMYALGCRSFLTKPVDFQAFIRVMREMASYWFGLVVLPHPPKRRGDPAA